MCTSTVVPQVATFFVQNKANDIKLKYFFLEEKRAVWAVTWTGFVCAENIGYCVLNRFQIFDWNLEFPDERTYSGYLWDVFQVHTFILVQTKFLFLEKYQIAVSVCQSNTNTQRSPNSNYQLSILLAPLFTLWYQILSSFLSKVHVGLLFPQQSVSTAA